MRVAVVIPCHDDGATLPEALASTEAQEPHELVVVDDGSTDPATLALLDRLRADGVAVVRQENAGLSAARMAGVRATAARYVQPLDADDLLVPGALALLADALDADPRLAAVWGDVRVFGTFEFEVRLGDVLDPWLLWHLDELPPTPMVRREAIVRTGGWTLNAPYEDWDFWLALAEHRLAGARVPAATMRYRRTRPRLNADALARHGELQRAIRARHPHLAAERRRHWLASRAPWRTKLLFPPLDALPLPALTKHRLRRLIARPRQTLAARRARRAAEGDR